MWEKVKAAARLAWTIIQIIALPMAVVGGLYIVRLLRRDKVGGTGGDGSGTEPVGVDLDELADRQREAAAIAQRFRTLVEEGRNIIDEIRGRDN